MKLFFKKFFLFLGCTSILSLILFFSNLSDQYKIAKTYRTSYEKVGWNLHQVQTNAALLESAVIFFGDSRTQGNVNDSVLTSGGLKSVNFGVNHRGPDLEWYFTKRVHEVATPCLCVFTNTIPHGGIHKMSPLVISPLEYLEAIDRNLGISWLLNYSPYKIAFSIGHRAGNLFSGNSITNPDFQRFGQVPESDFIRHHLNTPAQIEKSKEVPEVDYARKLWRNFLRQHYFFGTQNELLRRKSMDLCNQSIIIPMPSFGTPPEGDIYGEYKIELQSICNNSDLWFDNGHLNQSGAKKFTSEILLPILKDKFSCDSLEKQL